MLTASQLLLVLDLGLEGCYSLFCGGVTSEVALTMGENRVNDTWNCVIVRKPVQKLQRPAGRERIKTPTAFM